ncbi:MAG: hypothetical protein L0Z50_39410 [Verrucomicrobiales bacterium]|nr:hypothetical protein [Verrucomicrobiales bacterium]
MEPTEDKFSELFSQLKAQDRRHVPKFEDVAHSPPKKSSFRPAVPRFRLALGLTASVVAIMAIGAVTLHFQNRSHEKEMRQWALLSEWAPITDSFLSHPQLAMNENITDSFMGFRKNTPETSDSQSQ